MLPVTVVLVVLSEYPTISISSPTFTRPYSMVPVTTVPLPGIVKVESTDIIKVLSIGLSGMGIVSSITFKSSKTYIINQTFFSPNSGSDPLLAARAEPFTTAVLSPS